MFFSCHRDVHGFSVESPCLVQYQFSWSRQQVMLEINWLHNDLQQFMCISRILRVRDMYNTYIAVTNSVKAKYTANRIVSLRVLRTICTYFVQIHF